MNCQQVQTQLSEYLDKTLDTIHLKSIENHLLSCVLCRAEAKSLADCIGQVRDLPVVEPPPGFAQRVMAHARESQIKPSIWRRFFSGVNFTVPVQASAVVLIALFAVLLYQRETSPQKSDSADVTARLPAAPTLTKEEAISLTDAAQSSPAASLSSGQTNGEDKSSAELYRQSAAQEKFKQGTDVAVFKDSAQTASQSIAGAKTEKPLGDALEAPRRAPIQAQAVATGRESIRPSAEALGGRSVIGDLDQPLFRTPFTAEQALSPLSEPASDIEFIVRRRSPERRDRKASPVDEPLRKRSETDSAMPAAKLAAPQTGSIVEIRWFMVPADRYEQFKKVLAAETTVESEKSSVGAEKEIALKSARDLIIKVMILSPAER